ncbi:MAG: AsmA family protein [Deltaproteobacteria bacterium]|nr:AsmA family protein [Deltaproteobacteria bacterium]
MKSFLKFAGIGIGVFILLLVAAIIITPLVVDPNDYKDRIVTLVEKQTGRPLKIVGDIGIFVFPWLGVELGAVELGNAPGFEAPLFAQVKQVQVRVRILPLLSKRVEADVVAVRGLTVNLERNRDGRTNWDDLIKTKPEKKPEKVEKPTPLAGAMFVGGVNVSDASVTWTDRAAGQRFAVRDLSVKTSAVTLVDPVDVKIGFAVDTGDLGIQGRIDTGTRINLDLEKNVYALKDIHLSADLKGNMIPGGKATIKGDGTMVFNAGTRRFDLSRFKLETGGLSLPPYTATVIVESAGSGDLAARTFDLSGLKVALTMTAKKERINAALEGKVRADFKAQKIALSDLALSLPEFNVGGTRVQLSAPQRASAIFDLAAGTLFIDGMKIAGTISGQALPGGSIPVVLGFRFKGDLNRQTVSMDPLQLDAFGMKTVGSLSVAKFQIAPEARGEFMVARFSPKEVLARLGRDLPNTADAKALSSAELSIAFSASADSLKVDKLAAIIDDSRLTGSAAVNNFASPNVRFDLALDRFNLDRYLPPKQNGSKAAAAAAPAPAAVAVAAAGIPLETLRKLVIDGKFHVLDLTASGVKTTNVMVGIRAKDGVIRTEPVTASLYDGSYIGAVELDVRSKEPKLTFDEKLSGVRLDRMLKALAINTGTVDVGGLSTINVKGSVATDAAFKVIRVEQLFTGGILGNKLTVGLDGSGALLNLNDQTLTAERLRLTLDDMKLQAKATVTGLFTKPSYKAEISVSPFNLRQVLARMGQKLPEPSDPKAMTVFEMAASISGADNAISAESLKIRLDDTRLEGKLGIQSQRVPEYTFDIRVDTMDADRYLPPKKKGGKPVAANPGATTATLPLDSLRTTNMNGKLAVGKLKVADLRLQDIQLQATCKDGLLTLNPLSAGLYGGTYKGNFSVDARGKQPQLAMDEKLAGVQIGSLLKDLQGRALLNGITNAGIKLTAMGADADAVTRTLNGKAEFQITDGSIEKLDIVGKICRAFSALSASSLKKEDLAAGVVNMITQRAKGDEKQSSDRTEFSEMKGSLMFTNGIGTNDDLILKSPLLRVEGTGKIDLPKQRLDYQATVALVKSCEGQGGKGFGELANYPIPVAINGPLDNLDVKPNLTAGIIKILQPQEVKDQRPAAPQQQPQLQTPQEKAPKKQLEEPAKELLKKGLEELLKSK